MAKYAATGKTVRLSLNDWDNISPIDVLRALKNNNKRIVGAQATPGGRAIDIVCTSEDAATEIASSGFDHGERHYDLVVTKLQPNLHVSFFVPIAMPDNELKELMGRYGKVLKLRRLHYKEADLRQFENGVRVIEYGELSQEKPGRIHYAGLSIGIKYTGQPKSCVRCSSFDHLVRDCPRGKKKLQDNQTRPSPPGEKAYFQTSVSFCQHLADKLLQTLMPLCQHLADKLLKKSGTTWGLQAKNGPVCRPLQRKSNQRRTNRPMETTTTTTTAPHKRLSPNNLTLFITRLVRSGRTTHISSLSQRPT